MTVSCGRPVGWYGALVHALADVGRLTVSVFWAAVSHSRRNLKSHNCTISLSRAVHASLRSIPRLSDHSVAIFTCTPRSAKSCALKGKDSTKNEPSCSCRRRCLVLVLRRQRRCLCVHGLCRGELRRGRRRVADCTRGRRRVSSVA